MERFSGDPSKLRAWLFELFVAIGQVDRELGTQLKKFLNRNRGEEKPEEWDPVADEDIISKEMY